jgi:UDP-2,3-diacylglucosamine pyrophosphatase LpxH
MVVLSDLHLGSPASTAHRDLLPFLDEVAESGRALCINGDGFDLLQGSATSLATEGFPALARLQEMAMAGVPIYYVLGNHDLVLEHLLFDLPFTVTPFLNLVSGDRLIRIEHGHVYEPFFVRHPGLYELGGRVSKVALFAKSDTYALWASAVERVDARRRVGGRQYPHHAAALDLFARGFDAVVFGHTHKPELTELEGGTFVNDGDWFGHRSIVTIDHGHLALAEWSPGTLLGAA